MITQKTKALFRFVIAAIVLLWVISTAGSIQRSLSIISQKRAHPTCSQIFGFTRTAQQFCDTATGTKTIPMPEGVN